MLSHLATRRLLSALVSRPRTTVAPPVPSLRLSTAAAPPIPPQPPSAHNQHAPPQPEPANPPSADEGGEQQRRRTGRASAEGDYEEEQARVLRAALPYVVKLGWSESAMISGARDVGVSPSIIGSFPRKEAALVEGSLALVGAAHNVLSRW